MSAANEMGQISLSCEKIVTFLTEYLIRLFFRWSVLHFSFNSLSMLNDDPNTFDFLHIQRENLRTDKTINFCEFELIEMMNKFD